jgi:hypothetical protein
VRSRVDPKAIALAVLCAGEAKASVKRQAFLRAPDTAASGTLCRKQVEFGALFVR